MATSGSIFQKDLTFNRSLLQCSTTAFMSLLLNWSSELHSERKKLLEIIEDISQEPDDLTLKSAISCHLRPDKESQKCKFCKAEDVFKSYESKLYIIVETITVKHCEDGSAEEIIIRNRKHTSGPLEICLDYVRSCLNTFSRDSDKSHGLFADCLHDASHDICLMGSYKKEFQVLRNIWKKYYDYTSEKDQLEMAKISVQIIPKNQKKLDSFTIYPDEVCANKLQYDAAISDCEVQLKIKLGKLYYLKNLEKAQNKDAPFEENCPVCCLKIENAWYVLQCGHCFCVSCTLQLQDRKNVLTTNDLRSCCLGFLCPLCRQFNSAANMNLLIAENKEDEDKIPLNRFYSTKVNAVTRCLLQLQKDEPRAKSLVFSSFIGFLNILHDALLDNGISSLIVCDKKHFEENIKEFKSYKSVKTLLIPLSFGCSGLNITEANHVFLLEPVLDNSLHHQAIGRAHRIGQKKQVTVHRFIIKDSIEESIYSAMSTSASNDMHSGSNITLRDLRNIFNKDSEMF